jgi:hypothetical protein
MTMVSKGGSASINSDVALASTAAITLMTVTGGLKTIVAIPTVAGTGYVAGEVLTVVQAGAVGGRVTVDSVGGVLGEVTALLVDPAEPGSGYVIASALATTGSLNDDCTVEISEIVSTPRQVTIHVIHCGIIASGSGAQTQCGKVSLRDGAVVIWTGYVYGSSTAAGQGISEQFKLGITFTPVTDVNVLYTAITNATTASVSASWS